MLFENELMNKTTGVFAAALLAVSLAACNVPEVPVDPDNGGGDNGGITDTDSDGIADADDNCVNVANGANQDFQADSDSDGRGDACDGSAFPEAGTEFANDFDNDGADDSVDTCPQDPAVQDDIGACTDTDGDNVVDSDDNCPATANTNQEDNDGDGATAGGDACDTDDDNDGVDDVSDACPLVAWSGSDLDNDGCSDVDTDGDTVVDVIDNCLNTPNTSQINTDVEIENNPDAFGDACDDDDDGDGILDDEDTQEDTGANCRLNPNPNCNVAPVTVTCIDSDGDGINDSGNDVLCENGALNGYDNCPNRQNNTQNADVCSDSDSDNFYLAAPDDNSSEALDNCPNIANDQANNFGGPAGDACEDSDSDTVLDNTDNCPEVSNSDQGDFNADNVGDACQDSDGDGSNDDVDNCPTVNPNDDDGNGCEVVSATPGDTNLAIKNAYAVWYQEILCYNNSNENGGPNSTIASKIANCVAPDGTAGNPGFDCPNAGNVTWAIAGEGTTGGTSDQRFLGCDYTSTAGDRFVVDAIYYGESDTGGTTEPRTTTGRNLGNLSVATVTGHPTLPDSRIFDIRDVNSKVPNLGGSAFYLGVFCDNNDDAGCQADNTKQCRFNATNIAGSGGSGNPYITTYSDTCVLEDKQE
jgi:hypothetical protein